MAGGMPFAFTQEDFLVLGTEFDAHLITDLLKRFSSDVP